GTMPMPHATQAYPFECKVFQFAGSLAATLAGGHRTFLLLLDEHGAVRSLTFEQPAPSWQEAIRRLTAAGQPHLFYDPFDFPECAGLSGPRIEGAVMEQLLGRPFQDADFVRHEGGSSRAPPLQPPGCYPTTWGVMF